MVTGSGWPKRGQFKAQRAARPSSKLGHCVCCSANFLRLILLVSFVTLAALSSLLAARLVPLPRVAAPLSRRPAWACGVRSVVVAAKGFPDLGPIVVEGAAAPAAAMGADDKRKAEGAPEGAGPSKKAAPSKLEVNPKRVRELRKGSVQGQGPVIYW